MHSEEIHNFHSAPNVNKVTKSGRMKSEYALRKRAKILLEITKRKTVLRHQYIRENNIKKGSGLHSSRSRQGPVAGLLEHDNELSGCIKSQEFLDQLKGMLSRSALFHIINLNRNIYLSFQTSGMSDK